MLKYYYPRGYRLRGIRKQILAIAKIFGLDSSNALEFRKQLPVLPPNAEGWFAIPSVDALAGKVTDPAEKYCRAVQIVLAKIADSRSFYNHREGLITPAQLRVHTRTAHTFDLIAETQKGDILIVAAQLGMRHRGESVRQACEAFEANEFGLGSLAVGSIVLTHPKRLSRSGELDIDCPGDELFLGAGGGYAPYFCFRDSRVEFGAGWCNNIYADYGSASGFFPQ